MKSEISQEIRKAGKGTIMIIALMGISFFLGWMAMRPPKVSFEFSRKDGRVTIQNTSDCTIYLYYGETARSNWMALKPGEKLNADEPPDGMRVSTVEP